MKKLLLTSALVCAFSGMAFAHNTAFDKSDNTPALVHATSGLPQAKAQEFKDSLRDAQEENKQIYDQLRQKRAELYGILTAPQFDRRAFIAKGKEIRDLRKEAEENRAEAFSLAASDLTQQERMRVARNLEGAHAMTKHKHMNHHASKSDTPDRPSGQMNQAQ